MLSNGTYVCCSIDSEDDDKPWYRLWVLDNNNNRANVEIDLNRDMNGIFSCPIFPLVTQKYIFNPANNLDNFCSIF